ncbi:PDDEXK nuclease domain-containing protein [uncultured Parabacteroides sp.]|uniref:PDDEXK nuclease domain-containing protein n=1 Tax=uncultured Parabacteroides sp. TaxID=512312 RepID=UPI0025CE5CF8|nr:PDDEXK nuclease domain-containing protein [uncultured Parabacteroides sp.]
MEQLSNQQDYRLWLTELKANIRKSQIKAAIAVNSELIRLYWNLGEQIVEKQQVSQWGSRFIEQLSKDLQAEFPDIKGLSASNLRRCKQFYLFYCQVNPICAQVVRELEASFLFEIPWGHHVLLLGRIKFLKEALFYIHKTVENGWSRAILEYHIEKGLFHQQGKSINNFTKTLLPPQSELANELLKDPYHFDFLQLSNKAIERDIENGLVQQISHFLLELGKGFAYMGRQYLLKVGKKDYYLDLLFYHTRLKCYIIIELKAKEFEPEYIGKLNFYISAINELVRDEYDRPTIGILLCKGKDDYEVEFSLRDINKPIGVSSYTYNELPEDIRQALPDIQELKNQLNNFELNNNQQDIQ